MLIYCKDKTKEQEPSRINFDVKKIVDFSILHILSNIKQSQNIMTKIVGTIVFAFYVFINSTNC